MPEGIDYFNRGHWLSGLQARVSYHARRRMFDTWRAHVGRDLHDDSLLDVGATPDRERLDSNCMLAWFDQAGLRLTLYSPEDISHLRASFPYAQILAARRGTSGIPAADASFDWVSSSAGA